MIYMDSSYYNFTSTGYLNSIGAEPVLFDKAIKSNDFSRFGGRYLLDDLRRGDHLDKIQFPVEFRIIDGKYLRDVIELRCVCGFLLSDRIINLFEQNNLTGWMKYDVIVKDKRGNSIPGFHGFIVTGKNPGVLTNPGNTTDFYRPDCWYYGAVCSQRVVDVLKANKISDFSISLLEEIDGKIVFNRILIK